MARRKQRPDLANYGRSLFGKLPTDDQQMDLTYFVPFTPKVNALHAEVQQGMLRISVAMVVRHNEVAPVQRGMFPVSPVVKSYLTTDMWKHLYVPRHK